MAESYLPTRDADLDAFAASFDSQIAAAPTTFGLSAGQASAFTALFATWHSAWVLTTDNRTKTPSAIQAKNDAKEAMVNGPGGIRELVGIIQHFPGTTNAMRVDLNITVPDVDPTPVPPPQSAPNMSIEWVKGRSVRVRLRDADNPDNRGKPDGVVGAVMMAFVGETAPDDPMDWSMAGQFTRAVFDVEFPSTVPAGSKVWLASLWYNLKGETGPASDKLSTNITSQLAQAA